MKTITTIAAALFIASSFNASAQDTKVKPKEGTVKQEPVKQETKTKAETVPQAKPATTSDKASQNTQAPAQSNTTPPAKVKPGMTKRTLTSKKAVKRPMTAPAKTEESAPVKKAD